MRRLGALFGLALLGVSGCNTYKYFDINVSFDQATFDDSDILSIARCRMLVTGADDANFILMMNCPNRDASDPHTVGVFEYSTFADSGTMNFELQAFVGQLDTPECMIGNGKLPLAVSGATTIMGNLLVAKNPAFGSNCLNVSPVGDGSQ